MYTFAHFVFSTFIHTHTYILTFLSKDLIHVLHIYYCNCKGYIYIETCVYKIIHTYFHTYIHTYNLFNRTRRSFGRQGIEWAASAARRRGQEPRGLRAPAALSGSRSEWHRPHAEHCLTCGCVGQHAEIGHPLRRYPNLTEPLLSFINLV